jgi:hypothetical protein
VGLFSAAPQQLLAATPGSGSVLIWILALALSVSIVLGMNGVLKWKSAQNGNLPIQPFRLMRDRGLRLQNVGIDNPSIKTKFPESLRKEYVSAKSSLFFHVFNVASEHDLARGRGNEAWRCVHKRFARLFVRGNLQFLSALSGNRSGPYRLHIGGNSPGIFGYKVDLIRSGGFHIYDDPRSLCSPHCFGSRFSYLDLALNFLEGANSREYTSNPDQNKGYVWGIFRTKETLEVAIRYTFGPLALYGGAFLLYFTCDHPRRLWRWIGSVIAIGLIAIGLGLLTLPRYWQDDCEEYHECQSFQHNSAIVPQKPLDSFLFLGYIKYIRS